MLYYAFISSNSGESGSVSYSVPTLMKSANGVGVFDSVSNFWRVKPNGDLASDYSKFISLMVPRLLSPPISDALMVPLLRSI